jgi:hypothetical protein
LECVVGLILAIFGAALSNSKNLSDYRNSVKYAKLTSENTFKVGGFRSVLSSRGYLFNMIGDVKGGKAHNRLFPQVADIVKPNSKLAKFLP